MDISIKSASDGSFHKALLLGLSRPAVFCLLLILSAADSRADTLITDFFALNPLNFAYTGSTWATPTNQFEFFTNGSVSGQEVVPLGGGNPTVSGGAGHLALNLDLSGDTGLALTALLLPANQASAIQALLFDGDGTILRFTYPVSNFSTSIFQTAVVNVTNATTVAAGATPGFNLGNVVAYEVQGNFFDPGGSANAAFDVRFDDLTAVAAPEPATAWFLALGLLMGGFGVFASNKRMNRALGSSGNLSRRTPILNKVRERVWR